MKPEEFIKWLDETFLFLGDAKTLNQDQTRVLKDKLSEVFNKVTPNYLNTENYIFKDAMLGKTPSGCGFPLTPENLFIRTC